MSAVNEQGPSRSDRLLDAAIYGAGVPVGLVAALLYFAAATGLINAISDLLARQDPWATVSAIGLIIVGLVALLLSLFLFLWYLVVSVRCVTYLSERRTQLGAVALLLAAATALAVTAVAALAALLWTNWESWAAWIPVAILITVSWGWAWMNIMLEAELGPR